MAVTKETIEHSYYRERRSPERIAIDRADAKKLIMRFCKGQDDEAFTIFYRQQSHKLWRFLVARGCEQELAYDILSETFFKFSQSICKDPHAPVAFLYRIAINLTIDQHRKNSKSPVIHDDNQVNVTSSEQSQDIDEHEQLRHLVNKLSENEQNLLLMRYWLGMTHNEVAVALGLPAGTIRRESAALIQRMKAGLVAL